MLALCRGSILGMDDVFLSPRNLRGMEGDGGTGGKEVVEDEWVEL